MPSTMDVRSFGSMRIQSSSNHRLTASNCAALSASSGVGATSSIRARDAGARSASSSVRATSPSTSLRRRRRRATSRRSATAVNRCSRLSTTMRRLSAPKRRSPSAIRGAQLVRVDDVLVDLEERHVVVERLVQQDHELDEVRARLLPERLLAAAEQVGHQRGDAVRQRVGVEIVVQRVVAIRRVETDLDVVVGAAVAREDVAAPAGRSRLSLPGPGRRPCAPGRRRGTRAAARRRDTCRPRSCRSRWRRRWRCPCTGRARE